MSIAWHSDELPAQAAELGHGVCVIESGGGSMDDRIVAFVEGFGWLHHGIDAVVRLDWRYFPADGPLHSAIEELVRTRGRLNGELIPGFRIHVNG